MRDETLIPSQRRIGQGSSLLTFLWPMVHQASTRTDSASARRATREEATKRAEEVATAIHSQKAAGVTLTGADRDSQARSLEVLEPFVVTLYDAVDAYAKTRHKLQKASLNEAVDFYLRHHPTNLPAKTVKEVADELLAAKK